MPPRMAGSIVVVTVTNKFDVIGSIGLGGHSLIAVVLQPLHNVVDRERIGPLHGDTCATLGQGVMKSRRDEKVNRRRGGLPTAEKDQRH